ncbi:hypothetical protein AMJ49_01705 [Parcubacteria bacterium DG_74_2]|nr:MAG: hypothetical protein AMJ49_01705 [Parcubacteria bacterium DG_74_2]
MRPLIVANWKMNPKTIVKSKQLFNSVKKIIKDIKNVEVVICPPFIYLPHLLNTKSSILNPKLGAQDCFWKEKGAFTGEISPKQLSNLGCQYVIVGHSTRRTLGETNEMINRKIKAALKAKLKPILCIGETKKERKEKKTKTVLKKQLRKALNHLSFKSFNRLIIAYEPIWAIGTGRACGIFEAKKANLFIRKITKKFPILYGGSVNSKNALSYIKESEFQGLLVGGASLKAKEFIKIVKNCVQ